MFKKKKFTTHQFSRALWSLARFIIIFGLAFIILKPIYYKISVAFMSEEDILNPAVSLLPSRLCLDYWKSAISQLQLPNSFLQTLFISLLASVLQVFVATTVGYGLGRFQFKGNKLIFAIVILFMLIPTDITSTAQYIRFAFFGIGDWKINILETYWPLVILSATGMNLKNGLYIYLMREFFKNMPGNLEEAAYIDGCGPIRAFVRVIFPNAKAMVVTVFLFSFCWQWTEYAFAKMYYPSKALFGTILPQLTAVTELETTIVKNAGGILIAIPVMILFLIFQRTLVKSITLSGMAN